MNKFLEKFYKVNLKKVAVVLLFTFSILSFTSCTFDFLYSKEDVEIRKEERESRKKEEEKIVVEPILSKDVYVDYTTPYATYSIINEGHAILYYHNPLNDEVDIDRKVVAVNAGHGTKNGSRIMTFAHPDFTPKVAGGTNKEGSILSSAISDGTVLLDGRTEAEVNLSIALSLKEKLLDADYDVLMLRVDDDARLDNIARTVIANKNADVHISIHIDSTDYDKGVFFITPYNDESYLNMEPLKSNKKNITSFGKCLIEAFKEMGENVWKDLGTLQGDLTQLSYSTNASVDIEVGDKATVFTDEKIDKIAECLKLGVDKYFLENNGNND